MLYKPIHKDFREICYIFFSSFISGLVLVGISSSFALMLAENGIDVATITKILFATVPYSLKFAISPFVKNIITKYESKNYNIIRLISYICQTFIFIGFASLGQLNTVNTIFIAPIVIFFTILFTSVHDILRAHIKLMMFDPSKFGLITAIENTGFRIGMLVSGATILYVAHFLGWKIAFLLTSITIFFSTVATFRIKQIFQSTEIDTSTLIKSYILSGIKFFKETEVFVLIIVLISFKLSDSCINSLKPMFMQYLNISKIEYANIVHLIGMITMIISGIIAGYILTKIELIKCVRIVFIAQTIISTSFLYLSIRNPSYSTIAIIVNVSTFVFGYAGVVLRTFLAHISQRDVNKYTMFLSIGSLMRISLCCIGGSIVHWHSWKSVWIICILSNIPGYYLAKKLNALTKN